jgi:putative sigma-54 modulation protein
MQIEIYAHGVELSDSLTNHIKRRIEFALSRFRDLVQKVVIYVADENGPKGGMDKSCLVRIKTDERSELVIKDTESNIHLAVNRAISRSKHSLSRHIQKTRLFQRKRIETQEITASEDSENELY